MKAGVTSRAHARVLVPFLESQIDELDRQPSSTFVTGERAAYTRLSLMARVPFRSLERLRAQCVGFLGYIEDPVPYIDGLGHGYQAALTEIDRRLSEPDPPSSA